MQATIAWSYDLLDDVQRTLLNRLAIFAGGFTLEAAELVCPDEQLHVSEVATLLASLVDKSLVNPSFDHEPTRYTLLESVRAYAFEQLAIADSVDAVSRRHALWLARKSDEVQQSGIYEPFLYELANIRAALQWALSSEDEQDALTAGRIVGGSRRVWIGTGRHGEYRFWSESLLKRIDASRHPEVVAHLLAGFAQASEAPAQLAAIERAISSFEGIHDYTGLAHLHGMLCAALRRHGRFEESEKAGAEAVRFCETHGLERSEGYVHGLGELAQTKIAQRQTKEARAHVARALEMVPSAELDQRWHAWLVDKIGMIEYSEGHIEKALELTEEALRLHPAIQSTRVRTSIQASLCVYHLLLNHLDSAAAVAYDVLACAPRELEGPYSCIRSLAAIAALRGDAVAAARILGFLDERFVFENNAGTLGEAVNGVLVPALRERLPEAEIERLRAEGRTMTFDQAIDAVTGATEASAS